MASLEDQSKEDTVASVQPVEDDGTESENYKPRTVQFWLVMSSMYIALFLVALDRTIIATAIPKITDDFGTISDIGWYGSAYMLTAAASFPSFGRLYQVYSTKYTYLISVIIFEVGSAICGAAPNSVSFIVGRAIAGLGSSGIFSGGMMIMMALVPLRRRPTYTAIFGLCFMLSSVLGPIVGGVLTDKVTWRWCFYINLPLGGFTMLAIFFLLNAESPKLEKTTLFKQIMRLDPIGVFLLLPSLVCLVLALQWGGSTYSWSAPKIIGLLVTFAVVFIIFIAYEMMTPETAVVPSRIIKDRSVAGSAWFIFLLYGGLIVIIYFLATYFQAVKGDSAEKTGVSLLPFILAMVVASVPSAKLTERFGYYVPPMLIGCTLCAIGAGLMATLKPNSSHSAWIGYQVIFGFGMGSGFQASTLVVQNVLPKKDIPLGLALIFFTQQLGGAVFLAVGQNLLSSKLVERLSGVAGLDTDKVVNTGATDIRRVVHKEDLGLVIDAYNYALTRTFILASAISGAAILGVFAVKWIRLKGTGPKAQVKGKVPEKTPSEAESA